MGIGSWIKEKWEKEVKEPITDTAKKVLGDDVYDALTYSVIDFGEDIKEAIEAPADAQKEMARLAQESAQSAISSAEMQYGVLQELYAPYYEQATKDALPRLQQMLSGEYTAPVSKIYEQQKEMGTRAIKRQAAARGLLGSTGTETQMSTGTEMRLADFLRQLGVEESERQYGTTLAQIQLGSGAAGAISSAGSNLAGNIGSIYGTLGRQMSLAQQAQGAARQSLFQTLGNTATNFGLYMATQ